MSSKAFLVLLIILPAIYSLRVQYALNDTVNLSCPVNQRISVKTVKRCPELTELQDIDQSTMDSECKVGYLEVRAISRAIETCHGQKMCKVDVTSDHLVGGYKTLVFDCECIMYDGAHDRVH